MIENIYIEVNRQKEITDITEYKDGSVKKHLGGYRVFREGYIVAFAVNVEKYVRQHPRRFPAVIPLGVDQYLRSYHRSTKIKKLKEKINGSSI